MNSPQILSLVNHLMVAKVGKPLHFIQEAILIGAFNGETYEEIAEKHYISKSHVKDLGAQLWQNLSNIFHTKITKKTFRSILNNFKNSNSSSTIINFLYQDNSKISVNNSSQKEELHLSQFLTKKTQIDLDNAPKITGFCDRLKELSTLEKWLVNEQSRLIALLGIKGIGKTQLSLKLVEQIKDKFDYIIYRSLQFKPTLETTLNNLLKFFSGTEINGNIEQKISQLMKSLKDDKCLIILDDIQAIFTPQKFAGEYQEGYENYRVFFEKIVENNHQSCLLLNSNEKLRELTNLEYGYNNYLKSLILTDLEIENAKNICQNYNLNNPETWETLITIYQGNPSWLKLTAQTIKELFKGKVSEFLSYQQPVLCECLQAELEEQFKHLTNYEKNIINLLANSDEAMTLNNFNSQMELSPSDLLNAIQSLNRRFLVEIKEEENVTKYSLNCIIKEYVKIYKQETD